MPEHSRNGRQANATLARGRGRARRFAMQAIYQWQMTADDIGDIKRQYIDDNRMDAEDSAADRDYYAELVEGVYNMLEQIDPLLERFMPRTIDAVDPVERAILRIATYELMQRLDVPYRVVLNEAVMLTKKFCSEQSHTFINAVLDKVAREVRQMETGLSSGR